MRRCTGGRVRRQRVRYQGPPVERDRAAARTSFWMEKTAVSDRCVKYGADGLKIWTIGTIMPGLPQNSGSNSHNHCAAVLSNVQVIAKKHCERDVWIDPPSNGLASAMRVRGVVCLRGLRGWRTRLESRSSPLVRRQPRSKKVRK
jgi:hypothetical protein